MLKAKVKGMRFVMKDQCDFLPFMALYVHTNHKAYYGLVNGGGEEGDYITYLSLHCHH